MKKLPAFQSAFIPLIVVSAAASLFAARVDDGPQSRMVFLKGGAFMMGTPAEGSRSLHDRASKTTSNIADSAHATGDDDERPVHQVTLDPFYMDATEATNEEFSRFVEATGYRTDAERKGFSWVFKKGFSDWEMVKGADWRHPLGPDSDIAGKMNHAVVNVSWNDAAAFARWAGKRLPTEAEWEYAARGGRERSLYPWGDLLKPGGKALANFWQGTWPEVNHLEDGYYYTAPAGSFQANGLGLHDVIGNVWEWTADYYDADYYKRSPAKNPKGPRKGDMRVARGGSWFCSENYCGAYRVGFRGKSPQDASFNNMGFRCARDAR